MRGRVMTHGLHPATQGGKRSTSTPPGQLAMGYSISTILDDFTFTLLEVIAYCHLPNISSISSLEPILLSDSLQWKLENLSSEVHPFSRVAYRPEIFTGRSETSVDLGYGLIVLGDPLIRCCIGVYCLRVARQGLLAGVIVEQEVGYCIDVVGGDDPAVVTILDL